VLFITSWYPTTENTYGGVFVREHAKAVRAAGHRVVIVHLAGGRPEPGGGFWALERELDPSLSDGIEVYHVLHRRLRVRGASYPLYLLGAIAAYRRLCREGFRPDVIHAHVYAAGVPAALIGGRSGIPVVLTEHTTAFPRRTLSTVELRKARYAFHRAARVLPVSRDLREAIRRYGINVPFEVVPNAVDTSLFFTSLAERQPEKGTRRLLFVGNLEPSQHKGFPALLQALVRLCERRRDWHLDVVGNGPELLAYKASADRLGLRDQVEFHGSQPKPVIAAMMRTADLFVLPSRIETFGVAIAEALACGLPVVSTTVGAIPELVNERSGRLVPPDDPSALADALDDTLGSIDAFDHRAIASAARDRYSLEVVGERLTKIYESVLAESTVN
jgi:glycosyltransferase involved in cell wall biosynthesis